MSAFHAEQSFRQTYIRIFLTEGTRRDGRGFEEFRTAVANVKSLHNADSSAIIRLGETVVVCGIKAELAKPKAETPKEGYIISNVELSPICSPRYQPGPPSDEAQQASSLISRAIQYSKIINNTDLCISPDNLVWVLYIDIVCLNQNGSFVDAAICSVTAALQNLTLPKVNYDVETAKISVDADTRIRIQMNTTLFSATFAIFDGDYIICEPTAEEEELSSGLATFVVYSYGGNRESFPLHIPASRPITEKDIEKMRLTSQKRADKLRQMLQVASTSPER